MSKKVKMVDSWVWVPHSQSLNSDQLYISVIVFIEEKEKGGGRREGLFDEG